MSSSDLRRSRPFGAGSAGVAAVLVLGLAGLLSGCGGSGSSEAAGPTTLSATAGAGGSATPDPADTYGSNPTFLPPDTLDSGFEHRVVNAYAHHPALATQGDTVRVHIGSASVLATLTGPDVPVAGQQYQAPASPATWSVTLKSATKPVRLDPKTFQAVDEAGAIYNLTAEGNLPRVVEPGRVVRFELYSPGIAVGEGRLRWIPVGHLAPVEWDFTVETD